MSRKNIVEDYAISLDIGNASVGWVAFTPNYRLVRAKGHELIGARLFEPASTAEERRMARTTRRRYSRRRWRLRMLDSMFDQALSEVDPSFLMRRKYSWVHPEDKNNEAHWFGGVLFDSNEQDKRFYEKYPTIYHLRKSLMEDDERHDIREVYLAIHHMMKYRGNFLTEGELAPSSVFDVEDFLKLLTEILQYADEGETDEDLELQADANGLTEALCTTKGSRSIRAKNAISILKEGAALSKRQEAIISAVFAGLEGNKLDLTKVFPNKEYTPEDKKTLALYFNKADYDEKRVAIGDSGLLEDNECDFLDCIRRQYSAIALKQLLGDFTSISESMCARYEQHQRNWDLIKRYCREESNAENINKNYGALVGWEIVGGQRRSIRGAKDYENKRKAANKFFEELIKGSALPDQEKERLLHDIENDELFPVQRDSGNGVIPYQLHLNELKKIIQKQGRYYPFLLETYIKDGKEVNKLEGLLAFRVPYYVGPLVSRDDMQSSDNGENHWMIRRKKGVITPWNFDEMVDKDKSGHEFIKSLDRQPLG